MSNTNGTNKNTSQPIDKETAQIIALELFKLQQAEQDGAKRNNAQQPTAQQNHQERARNQTKSQKAFDNNTEKPNINAKNVLKLAIIVFYVVVEILLLIYLKQFIFT